MAGRDLRADVELVPLRPYYQIRFRDGTRFEYGPDIEAEVARLSPRDLTGFRRFMADTEQIYRRAFKQLGRRPFYAWRELARVGPELVRLGAHRSVYAFVSVYVRDEHLRCVLSFHPLFLGGNPFKASATYSIGPYLERQGGVWFAQGGMHALVRAMGRLFAELGGEIRCGEPVSEILAAGVRLAGGAVLAAEVVVSNADVTTTYEKLVPPAHRGRHVGRRQDRYSYSMSCFLLYLRLDRQYPHLRHHTILMPRDYRGVVEGIFGGRLREDDLAVYLLAPTRTDPTLAPPAGESI